MRSTDRCATVDLWDASLTAAALRGCATARSTQIADQLAVEEPLTVRVNGVDIATTMRTPGHDIELALGWLVSEGSVDVHQTSSGLSRATRTRSRYGSRQTPPHLQRG